MYSSVFNYLQHEWPGNLRQPKNHPRLPWMFMKKKKMSAKHMKLKCKCPGPRYLPCTSYLLEKFLVASIVVRIAPYEPKNYLKLTIQIKNKPLTCVGHWISSSSPRFLGDVRQKPHARVAAKENKESFGIRCSQGWSLNKLGDNLRRSRDVWEQHRLWFVSRGSQSTSV